MRPDPAETFRSGTGSRARAPGTVGERGVTDKGGWWLLGLLLVAALALRLLLLDQRWINPDEGAHLMSGRLTTDGLVPGVDFGTRQVLYVYILAFFIQLFGTELHVLRVVATAAWCASAVFIFLLGRGFFDRRVGLLAAVLFLYSPFAFVLSMNAKTQPYVVLFSVAAVWFVVEGIERRGNVLLFAGGLLTAFAYFVRESSLAVLLALSLVLLLAHRKELGLVLRRAGAYLLGFLVVAVAVQAAYVPHLGLSGVLDSSLNPLHFVYSNVVTPVTSLLVGAPEAPEGIGEAIAREEGPSLSAYWTVVNLREALLLNAFFLVGAFLAPFLARRTGSASGTRAHRVGRWTVLYAWAGCLGLAYAYWTLRRGFFQAYLLELIPPLSILTAAAAVGALARVRRPAWADRRPRWLVDIGLLAGTVLTLWGVRVLLGAEQLNRPLYFIGPAILLAAFYLPYPRRSLGRLAATVILLALLSVGTVWIGPTLPGPVRLLLYGALILVTWAALVAAAEWRAAGNGGRLPLSRADLVPAAAFCGYAAMAGAVLYTGALALPTVDLRYDSVWPTETLREVAGWLERHAGAEDRVLSGAVVWEFQAGLRPYRNVSHPLRYLQGIPPDARAAIEDDLDREPPRFIIRDRYTERLFISQLPLLQRMLEEQYVREITVTRFPRDTVIVYRLRAYESTTEPSGTSPQ